MHEASPADHAHFAAIAEGERCSEEERIDRALSAAPGERILEGLRMGTEGPWTQAHLAELDARSDEQMELARRRIALGLGVERAR